MIETALSGVPKLGLEETVRNMGVLIDGITGAKCPRCGSTDFWKRGFRKTSTKNEKVPCRVCKDCGYTFTILDINDACSHNRAARILNLDNKKVDTLLEDNTQFGLIEKNGDVYSSKIKNRKINKVELYHNVPVYHHLLTSLGANPKRADFEKSLAIFLNGGALSKVKRDILWRRYQEIAIDVFVCEKSCKFSSTCNKKPREKINCETVKKAKQRKREWKVDIVI